MFQLSAGGGGTGFRFFDRVARGVLALRECASLGAALDFDLVSRREAVIVLCDGLVETLAGDLVHPLYNSCVQIVDLCETIGH